MFIGNHAELYKEKVLHLGALTTSLREEIERPDDRLKLIHSVSRTLHMSHVETIATRVIYMANDVSQFAGEKDDKYKLLHARYKSHTRS